VMGCLPRRAAISAAVSPFGLVAMVGLPRRNSA
jgi:hypothetical protein